MNPFNIRVLLEAKDLKELYRLQYLARAINRIEYQFTDIKRDSKGYYCCFFADIKEYKDPTSLTEQEMMVVEDFTK